MFSFSASARDERIRYSEHGIGLDTAVQSTTVDLFLVTSAVSGIVFQVQMKGSPTCLRARQIHRYRAVVMIFVAFYDR